MGHRIAGLPSLLPVVSDLATHPAGAGSCTEPHIPLQGRVCVCTSTDNRSVWLASLASQYPPGCCRKFARAVEASAPHGASERSRPCVAMDSSRAWGDRPASRTSALFASMLAHPLHWVGIRCRRLERQNTSRTRRCGAGLRKAQEPAVTIWTLDSETCWTIRQRV